MSEQLSILMLAGQFYPDLAGSGIATHSIAEELSRRGHEVAVCVDDTNEYMEKVDSTPPFTLGFIPGYKQFMTGEAGFKQPTEAIYDVIKDNDYDIVHAYSYMPMLLLSIMEQAPPSSTFFTFWNAPHIGERAIGLYESPELDLQLARHIISLCAYKEMILGSQCSYESALDLGANPSTTSFTYHGIDMMRFQHNLQEQNGDISEYFDGVSPDSDEAIITLPGRITARKGVFEAIGALSIIRQTHDARLLLTSTGKEEDLDAVMDSANMAGVAEDVVISEKMVPQEHMPMLYKQSDVIITPSYFEGLGFTAIEALAAARPLVITDVPGLNEVGTSGVNCLSVPAKNKEALANAVIRLLDDEQLAERLASEGPKDVQKFDIKLFVDYLLHRYERTL